MELIRCPQCAKEIPDVSRFCRRCGSAVAWGAPTSWAGLPRSAWESERPVSPPSSRNRYKSPARPAPAAKRNGGSAWAASAMIGAATFMFVSHVHRATTGPMVLPRPVERPIRPSPVRVAPPPQFYYPRPPGSSADRRFAVEPPVIAPPTLPRTPGRVWEGDQYDSRNGRGWEERDRNGATWRED